MTHLVLLTLKDKNNIDMVMGIYKEAFFEMENLISYISNVKIFKNVFERDKNYDFMVQFDIESISLLNDYLVHDLHKKLVEKTGSYTKSVGCFDYEV